MSEILHGRYRVETWGKWRPTIAVDVETGARVLLPEDGARGTFVGRVRMRRVAARFSEIRDPRFVGPVSLAPVVVPCPSHWTSSSIAPFDPALRITVAEAVDAALELIELTAIAARAGARVSADDAMLARDATGALTLRVVAPTEIGVDPEPAATNK